MTAYVFVEVQDNSDNAKVSEAIARNGGKVVVYEHDTLTVQISSDDPVGEVTECLNRAGVNAYVYEPGD